MTGKLGLRMTTLHEEISHTGNHPSSPIQDDDEEKSDADYSEYEAYKVLKFSFILFYKFKVLFV